MCLEASVFRKCKVKHFLKSAIKKITQEPNENTIAFLERLKEALQQFTNLDFDSYEGQVILKDKFLSHCASDIRIVTTATTAGPCSLFG